ncbi:MAG: hypothetical protein Q7R60_00080 [bacterium]|nr:hypothetical protein [bacterium]
MFQRYVVYPLEDLLYELAMLAVALIPVAIVVGIVFGCLAAANVFTDNETDVSRQVTNVTYAAATGAPVYRDVVVQNLGTATTATFAPPACVVNGRDLLNPSGVQTPATDKGVTIGYKTHNGIVNVTLPSARVGHQYYTGKAMLVRFHYQTIPLYYDNTWNSIWATSAARGPKDAIIACMGALAPSLRATVGLLTAKVMLPAGTPVPPVLQ